MEHLDNCQSCTKVYKSMTGDEEIEVSDEEKKTIDFLKKQKRSYYYLFAFAVLVIGIVSFYFTSYNKKLKVTQDFREFAVNACRGDTFTFGTYEQDGNTDNGQEDIVWYVLKNKDGQIFAMSKYILDCYKFNPEEGECVWKDSKIREWLNEEFCATAFNSDEQFFMASVEKENPANPYCNAPGSEATSDKVTLLSFSEAEGLSFDLCVGYPTKYAIDRGTHVYYSTNRSTYWIRSVGVTEKNAAIVDEQGYPIYLGLPVDSVGVGVRPCIYINYQ